MEGESRWYIVSRVNAKDEALKMGRGRPEKRLIEHAENFPNCSDPEFGTVFLNKFVKEGASLTDAELKEWSVEYDWAKIRLDGGRRRFSYTGASKAHRLSDGPFIFRLCKNGTEMARVAFDAIEGGIRIVQIQAKKGVRETLLPIKWERALIAYACRWAEEWGLEKVEIRSAKNNPLTDPKHLPYERARVIYDVSAKRSGFRLNEEENWVKYLGAA
ncbi:Uncharacterised protein [uncultured archaeon]|nr:Uncharacterised protein [uncultured archaeon]